ncbi:hypothetical protein MUN77_03365 [Leucobacter allii]|uniref:hypothetical protein n=1 Tax=Leucobacter allii TaxID=2932247 RepID=UPI001FD312AD|nr:hypothetical protein [Leucobacter allii]UOR02369.1 hypothetical protein MUN77_03365 [Leucobacter allii]
MNPDDHIPEPGPPEAARSRLHPTLAAAMAAERARSPEEVEAERSMLATHRDPSLTQQDATTTRTDAAEADTPEAEGWRRTQVRWVRPTELIAGGGARATGWGVDLRAELLRRTRESAREHRAARSERSERAKRLPDLSIGGRRRTPARREAERAGMGLR